MNYAIFYLDIERTEKANNKYVYLYKYLLHDDSKLIKKFSEFIPLEDIINNDSNAYINELVKHIKNVFIKNELEKTLTLFDISIKFEAVEIDPLMVKIILQLSAKDAYYLLEYEKECYEKHLIAKTLRDDRRYNNMIYDINIIEILDHRRSVNNKLKKKNKNLH